MRIVLLMLLIASLSGCASVDQYVEPSDEPEPEPVQEAEPEPDINATPEESVNETAENLAPVLDVTLDAVNGTAPLLVNITIDASDDSDALSWAVFIDGNETRNGTAVPVTFNHTFEAGNWSVVIQLSDGEHVVEEAFSLSAAPGDPNAGLPEPEVLTGNVTTAALMCPGGTFAMDGRFDGWTFVLAPEELSIQLWQGEDDSDPFTNHDNEDTVPEGTTSGHICHDSPAGVGGVAAGAETAWTITFYPPGYVR